MSDDPMVLHPPHYGTSRFGVECIEFTRLMPFCAGNAFKYVWRCEDKGNPVQDLDKARVYWAWAWEAAQPVALPRQRELLSVLYFRHLEPKRKTDWMARVLGDILWEDWEAAGEGIDARREFFVLNGGRP